MATLPDLTELSREQLIAQIEAMRIQPKRLTIKVTEKGAVGVYGLGQWPVTLYRSQWERLLPEFEAIAAFIKANAGLLSEKPAR